MTGQRSIKRALFVRLGVILSLSFLGLIAWLFWHLNMTQARMQSSDPHAVMAEFFVDIAWTLPVISIVTMVAAGLSVSRCLGPLNDLSRQQQTFSLVHYTRGCRWPMCRTR